MAEEISNNVNQATTAVNQLDNAISNTTDSTKNLIGQAQKIASITNRQFNPLLATLDKLKRKISQNTREFDDFETILSRTEKGVSKLSTSFTLAAFANNKQAMMSVNTMHRYAEQMRNASLAAKNLAVTIDGKTAILRQNIIAMAKNKEALDRTGIAEERLAAIATKLQNVKLGDEFEEITKNLSKDEKKTWDLVMANIQLAKSTGLIRTELEANVDEYQKAQEELVTLKNRSIDAAESQAMVNIEARKMQGGMTALSASVEGIVKGKFFSQLRDLMSGATIIAGFALIAKGFSDIGDQALKVNQIALSLGDTSEESFGRFWKSGAEAQKMTKDLNDSAIRLGYSMDELSGVANKFMLGTKMDKEGRLGAASIAAMTQETARFAKVAGIDTAEAADLMDKRIRRFGMTASEAVSSMQDMRVTLMQMTAGMKGNMVDLGNMVKIIDEAAESSQSYIVDTRLMTQALRGAVTQAQNLGMAQKQAQDIAKGLGKILSTTPDFIKIPAGQALVTKLMGTPEEADKILLKLDKGTRKQVKSLIDGMKKGTIGQYSGTKALMALIGQTEVGIEAQMDQLNMVIGDGAEAAQIVKETFQIENDATAQAITTMIKEAKKVQDAFKDEKISFSAAIAKDAALFNEALDKAGDDKEKALKALEEKGASKKQSEKYLDIYNLKKQKEDELRKLEGKNDEESRAKRIAIEKEILGITKDQLIAVDRMLDPTKELISDIEKKTGKTLDIDMKLDTKTLKEAGIKSAKDLGDKIGMDYDKNTDYLEKAFSGASKQTIQELRDNRIKASKMAEETRKQMEDISHFFADPIKGTEAAVKVFANWIGLFGPWGKIVTGSLLAMAGVMALWKGGSWIVEKGTFQALKQWGPNGPGGTGTGTGTGSSTKGGGGMGVGTASGIFAGAAIFYEMVDNFTAKFDANGNRIQKAGEEEVSMMARTTETLGALGIGLGTIGMILAGSTVPLLATVGGALTAVATPLIALAAALLIGIAAAKAFEWGLNKITGGWYDDFWDKFADNMVESSEESQEARKANRKQQELLNEKLKKKGLTDEEIKTANTVGVGKFLREREGKKFEQFDQFSPTTMPPSIPAEIPPPTIMPPSISTAIPSTPTEMPEQQNQSTARYGIPQNFKQKEFLRTDAIVFGDDLRITIPRSTISEHLKEANQH